MRTPIAAVVLFLTTSAEASTLHLARGELKLTRTGHATLTIVVRSTSVEAREVVQAIELPVGMTATAVSVAIGESDPVTSIAFARDEARANYESVVAMIKDPALLEHDGARRAILSVFPVRRDVPATVIIELTATSLVTANQLAHLDEHTSLVAAPNLHARGVARYAYYRAPAVPKVADERLAWRAR
jgi:hypothetical protein